MRDAITSDQPIRLSTRLRYRAVGEDGVLVHLEQGRVLVVNEVGLHVVEELGRQSRTLSELSESLVREFDVDFERARADVLVFLDELLAEQALEPVGSGNE